MAKRRVFIITGASRGLGKALSFGLSGKNAVIFMVSRDSILSLAKEAAKKGALVKNVVFDLRDIGLANNFIKKIFRSIDLKNTSSVTFIHNAAVAGPMGFLGDYDYRKALDAVTINYLAPVVLSGIFAAELKNFKGKKIIINISSGAARSPIEGWSIYCSTKAALDMFTRCLAAEREHLSSGLQAYAIDPGAMDTGMQEQIRRAGRQQFPSVDKFIEWHKKGMLKTSEAAAKEIISFIYAKIEE